jgi:hypothetical protein
MMNYIDSDIADSTWKSYDSAVRNYQEHMTACRKDYLNPTLEDICLWLTEQALIIRPQSLARYALAVEYYLKGLGLSHNGRVMKEPVVKRIIRGAAKRYGLPPSVTREAVTISLLKLILKNIDLSSHNDRCLMAACIVALLSCLRCGEFTVKTQKDSQYLKRKDWKQDNERGSIYLARSKTDVFGRGNYIKYRRLACKIDPIFWMKFYADQNKVWSGNKEEALFVLDDGKSCIDVF